MLHRVVSLITRGPKSQYIRLNCNNPTTKIEEKLFTTTTEIPKKLQLRVYIQNIKAKYQRIQFKHRKKLTAAMDGGWPILSRMYSVCTKTNLAKYRCAVRHRSAGILGINADSEAFKTSEVLVEENLMVRFFGEKASGF